MIICPWESCERNTKHIGLKFDRILFIFQKAAEKSEDEKSATESEKPESDTEKAASSEKKEEEEEGEEAKEEEPPEKPYENPMLVHVSYLWVFPAANWLQRFMKMIRGQC